MTMNNVTRRVATLVALTFALRHSLHGQTTTTNTDCTINGNTANCTSTSTDDSAQRQARAAAQAEQDRANEQAGEAVGNAMGRLVGAAVRRHAIGKQYKAYCNQRPGVPWARRDAKGTVLDQGTCPGTVSKLWVVDKYNRDLQSEKLTGYVDDSGSTLTIHLESMSEMRFHMLSVSPAMAFVKAAGYQQLICTDDKKQKYAYDILAGRAAPITAEAPAEAPTVVPEATPAATPVVAEEEPLVNTGSSDSVTEAVASTIPQSAPAVAHAALAPATMSVTSDTTKPCVTDKSGHTVCLDQH